MKKISETSTSVISKTVTVTNAEINNIPGMIAVMEKNLIDHPLHTENSSLEHAGFLIYGFAYDEAKAAIEDSHNYICLVALEHGEVIGYTLGSNIKKLDTDYQNALAASSQAIRDIIFSENVFYHRHIAKKSDTKNIGKQLIAVLLERAKKAGYQYIICQIAEKPLQNKISKALHEQFGFVRAGFNQIEMNQFGVYVKKIDL